MGGIFIFEKSSRTGSPSARCASFLVDGCAGPIEAPHPRQTGEYSTRNFSTLKKDFTPTPSSDTMPQSQSGFVQNQTALIGLHQSRQGAKTSPALRFRFSGRPRLR
jgi:hypothetical protein